MRKNYKRGVTLIEILIVMTLVSLITLVVLANVNKARANARDAQRKTDIAIIQNALERYYNRHGQYPGSARSGGVPNGAWTNSGIESHWDQLGSDLGIHAPSDPLNIGVFSGQSGNNYTYSYVSENEGCDGQWYALVYRLEKDGGSGIPTESAGVMRCTGNLLRYSAGAMTVGVSPNQPL